MCGTTWAVIHYLTFCSFRGLHIHLLQINFLWLDCPRLELPLLKVLLYYLLGSVPQKSLPHENLLQDTICRMPSSKGSPYNLGS